MLPFILACTLAAPAAAQQVGLEWDRAGRSEPVLTLGLKPADAFFPIALAQSKPPGFAARLSFSDWAGTWRQTVSERLASSIRLGVPGGPDLPAAHDISFLPPPAIKVSRAAPDTAGSSPGVLNNAFGQYADIGMMIRGRGDLGGAWNRYTPCDPGLQLTCKTSLFPQLRPDVQFGVLVGGTISDRIHVNVDYDQTREFDAANNINVFYQGFNDEVLQRLEVGDVSIRLPASRYMTQGIPAGNFGFKATGQLGPVDFQTVFAQQRGDVTSREFRLGGTGSTQGLVQDETLSLDDADYAKGQFFFITNPDSLAGVPHIDVLNLRAVDARTSLRPASGASIEIYRDERPSAVNQQQQAQLGYFLADAVMPDGSRKHSGLFKRLQQEKDYVLHPSGLWIMLRAPLRADEALAISYQTESGDTVGTVNAERVPAGTVPKLLLLRGPASIHQPNFATWKYELHNVYRVHSASTVDIASIQLTISLGQLSAGRTFASTIAGQMPYIRLFGLDEDAPANALDVAQVYQPAQDLRNAISTANSGPARITGTFVIFPTLRPFFEPGPIGAARLSAAEAQTALGNDANGTIYNDVDPIQRQSAARFRLNFQYRVKMEGLVSSFNLGAFSLREESERIQIGAKQLVRGQDYNIDYDIGMVTLLDPQTLFATNPGAEIRATWEQKSQFQIAPTSVFGMNARYLMGHRGELNFVGLYQAEKTIMTRPELGVEPSAIFLGGTSGHLDLGGALLDRTLSRLPGLRFGGTSALTLNGEAAFSMPNPNTRNQAYVDDFESSDATNLDLRRRAWRLGSRPSTSQGASSYLPGALTVDNAAQLVWQHDYLATNGQPIGSELPKTQIDNQIQIAGTELPEPVMWLTLGDTLKPKQGQRWRSITTTLSTTGSDLTRSEYFEVYVRTGEGNGKALIVDIGTVGEDAFYFDRQGRTNGAYDDGTQWGLGILDAEARLALREIWGPETDARGLWNDGCTGTGANPGAIGDPAVNCARKNGYLDTEDLDGNGILDADDGTYFRYTIPLDAISQYLVRDRNQTGTLYQLYRIPLRAGVAINGASASTWRFVKHVRMTVTSNTARPADQFVLARMRIVGSRWVKRDGDGVSRGLLSDEKGLSGSTAIVEVSPVSRLTHGVEYNSPPLVRDQLQDPSQNLGGAGEEFNEKGLSLRYKDVAAGERAEVYFRYPQQPRSFLNYRQLQLWAVAKAGNFGPGGDQRLVVKIGTDPRNYYFYQAKLNASLGSTPVGSSDWLPQLTIDFEQWFDLKAKAELALLQGQAPVPGKPFVIFSADSTYGIVLEDRARAPNLAAVRELSFGVFNGSGNLARGEVWLNDVRLGAAFRDAGAAANLSLDMRGGDFLATTLSYANQGSLFRQLNQDAAYVANGDFSLTTSAQLGQLLPASWGLDMPMTFGHARTAQDPTLLEASDVQAGRLTGLRDIGSNLTRVALSVRKRTPSANPLVAAFVDGLALRMGYNAGNSGSITLRNEASGLDGSLSYLRDVTNADVDIVPSFLEAAFRLLAPEPIENSAFFKRITGARMRYTPMRLSFSSTYNGQERRAYQYNSILASAADASVAAIESPRRTLDADALLDFQPFNTLTAALTFRTSRDLLSSERASTRALERGAIQDARSRLAGLDFGWETARSLTSQFNFRPQIADWIRPAISMSSRFGTDRNPSYLEVITIGADSTAILQRRFQADRQLRRQVELQPYTLFHTIVSDTTGLMGTLGRALRVMQAINFVWNGTLGSQYDRETINPNLGYQFGIGDLESFRTIGIDSASSAIETGNFDMATSLRLLKTAQVDVQYTTSDLQSFDQRGGNRLENEVTWPNLRLNWSSVSLPSFVRSVIPSMGVTASYQVRQRDQALGRSSADRGSRETSVPFTARMTLPGSVGLTYAGNWTRGTSEDPTGDAQQGGLSHNVNLSVTFKPPESVGNKLKQPLRAALGLTQNAQHQCRVTTVILVDAPGANCISYLDFRNRALNLTLDTNVSDLVVGLQMGYTSRQDFVGSRRGNSQFQLGIFANFELPVGQLPAGAMGGIR